MNRAAASPLVTHHVGPDLVLGHQAVLDVGIGLHKRLNVLRGMGGVREGRRGEGRRRRATHILGNVAEDEDGAIHGLRQGTGHHQLALVGLRRREGGVGRVSALRRGRL